MVLSIFATYFSRLLISGFELLVSRPKVIIKEIEPEYVKDIRNIDPLNMSPMEALSYLVELKSKIN